MDNLTDIELRALFVCAMEGYEIREFWLENPALEAAAESAIKKLQAYRQLRKAA